MTYIYIYKHYNSSRLNKVLISSILLRDIFMLPVVLFILIIYIYERWN